MYIIMKKIISYCLLSAILFSLTELHEFVKIPFAIGHFIEHYSENSSTSIVDFLTEHYSANDSHSQEHSSLPFKEHCTSIVLHLVLYTENILIDFILPYSTIQYFQFGSHSTAKGTKLGVWQPPQTLSLS